jgi:hypothetical protein
MHTASFLTAQAAKCRRLARGIHDEPASKALLALADEFDAEALRVTNEAPKIESVSA